MSTTRPLCHGTGVNRSPVFASDIASVAVHMVWGGGLTLAAGVGKLDDALGLERICVQHLPYLFWGGVGQSDEWQANGRSIGGGNGATAWGKDGRGRGKDERAGATRVNPDVEEGTISKSHMIFLIKKKVYYRCG